MQVHVTFPSFSQHCCFNVEPHFTLEYLIIELQYSANKLVPIITSNKYKNPLNNSIMPMLRRNMGVDATGPHAWFAAGAQ